MSTSIYMRTPGSCSICGVMGHTRRGCLVARLRREGEQMGSPLTQEEENRVKMDLLRTFQESPNGIRWTRYQRELSERRARAREAREQQAVEARAREAREQQAREIHEYLARERQASEQEARRQQHNINISYTFNQIQSWARRAEREARSAIATAQQQARPKSLSLKMVNDFQENYTISTECNICYETIPNIGLPCKHTFCGECTVKFAKKSQNCPLCRCSFQEVHISRNIEPDEFNKLSARLTL